MIIRIVDLNPRVIDAAKEVLKDIPGVECLIGNMIHQDVDVWVTPTNSKGSMSGGLDSVIKSHLGEYVQMAVRMEIANNYNGHLPVGRAICINTKTRPPRYLVSTPTMEGESDDLRRTKNTAWACAAAFQAIYMANDLFGEPIASIAIPGLGAGTGKVEPSVCAELLLVGFRVFKRKRFTSFEEMGQALNEELVAIGMPLVAQTKGTEEQHTVQIPLVLPGGLTPEEISAKQKQQELEANLTAGYDLMNDIHLKAFAKTKGIDVEGLTKNQMIGELVDADLGAPEAE